jgi:hypothetical protein
MKGLLFGLLGVAVLTGVNFAAEPAMPSVQGVWQVVEVTTTGPGARTIPIPEPRPNLTIITAKHYSLVQVEAESRPALADSAKASADELRAVWGPFYGEAGTYTMDGNLITMRPIAAKNPAVMASGAFVTYTVKLDGNSMIVTAQTNQNGPIANPATVKAVRVE